MLRSALAVVAVGWIALWPGAAAHAAYDELIAKHAAAHGVPESLVRRVILLESRGNARVVSRGNYGLMQIRLGTARAMGYRGTAQGLLDPDTNMTYAVKYLAGAYRAAGCSADRAVRYYQRGYRHAARGKCRLPQPIVQTRDENGGVVTSPTPDRAPAQPSDVLKPRVVQTIPIAGPGLRTARTQTMGAGAAATIPLPRSAAAGHASSARQAPSAEERVAAQPQAALAEPPPPTTVAGHSRLTSASAAASEAVAPEPAAPGAAALGAAAPEAAAPRFDQPAALAALAPVPLPPTKTVREASPTKKLKAAPRPHVKRARARKAASEPNGLLAFLKRLTTPEPKARRRKARH